MLAAEQPTPQSLTLAKDTLKQINQELQLPGGGKVIRIGQDKLTANKGFEYISYNWDQA
jgi:hypothetical protein